MIEHAFSRKNVNPFLPGPSRFCRTGPSRLIAAAVSGPDRGLSGSRLIATAVLNGARLS